MPLVILEGISVVETIFALFVFFLDVRICGHMQTSWYRILLFPSLWATLWAVIGAESPIGRLLMWCPAQGFEGYTWLSRYTGPPGIDWVVAACAVVISQVIGAWLMGPKSPTDEGIKTVGQTNLIEVGEQVDEEPDAEDDQQFYREETRPVMILAAIIAALTLPSFIFTRTSLPPSSTESTQLTVGCVLPSPIYDKHHDSPLDDFIAASARMTSAKILIWPESAVTFTNTKERDAAFDKIRQNVRGPAVGVSFEEHIPAESGGQVEMRRNGFALLTPNNTEGPAVTLMYYKRHLVPRRSCSFIHGRLAIN
jgi:hypothetical protein